MSDTTALQHNKGEDLSVVGAEAYKRMVREIGEYVIFMLHKDNTIASWNRGIENILGYSEDEFIGQPVVTFFTPEDREQGQPGKEVDIAAATGKAADDRWHLRKDGSRFWASGVATAPRNEAGEVVVFMKA